MSNINKQALRKAADAANKSSWGRWESYHPHKGARGYEVKVGARAVAQHCLKVDAAFIAAANPATVLALLDELEAAEKRNVELSMLLEGADAIQTDYAEALECQDDNDSVLAAIVALKQRAESAEKHIAELRDWNLGLAQESLTHQQRIAELSGQKRLIGWRASDYTDETSDPELAKNWAAAIGVLPIFEGDVNTKLSTAGIGKGE